MRWSDLQPGDVLYRDVVDDITETLLILSKPLWEPRLNQLYIRSVWRREVRSFMIRDGEELLYAGWQPLITMSKVRALCESPGVQFADGKEKRCSEED